MRGGIRIGAGRPKGIGKFNQPTKPMRVPVGLIEDIMHFVNAKGYKTIERINRLQCIFLVLFLSLFPNFMATSDSNIFRNVPIVCIVQMGCIGIAEWRADKSHRIALVLLAGMDRYHHPYYPIASSCYWHHYLFKKLFYYKRINC